MGEEGRPGFRSFVWPWTLPLVSCKAMSILKNSKITTAFVSGGFRTMRFIRAQGRSVPGIIDDLHRRFSAKVAATNGAKAY